ncbi:MAG: hypothetical protein LBC49_04865 [Bacteroidales bacterium]|jgi:hypothetical protein|nr:hypothetical protein [Bacteroidales bacterium]
MEKTTKKAAVISVLGTLLKYGKYNNWGQPKSGDPKELLGYCNFKGYVIIDGKREIVRMAVPVFRSCEFYFPYYNMEVGQKKEKGK